MIEVSAGVIRRDQLILAAKRGEGRKNAHLWEFPGGKREPGEDAAACLIRELREELGLQVADLHEIGSNEAQGISFTFLQGYALNEPKATEHEDLRFVSPREMLTMPFCPADTGMVRRLNIDSVSHFMWDFDGTLMDTYPMITGNVLQACRLLGHEEDPQEILSLLKVELPHCIRVLCRRWGISEADFRAVYEPLVPDSDLTVVKPIPGIPEVLAALTERGAKHYIVTHRSRASCEAMLANHGLLEHFTGMVTAESPLPRKPHPARCMAVLKDYGIDAADAVMIGDRPLDIHAGHDAGLLTVLLDTEKRFPQDIADITVGDIGELMRC